MGSGSARMRRGPQAAEPRGPAAPDAAPPLDGSAIECLRASLLSLWRDGWGIDASSCWKLPAASELGCGLGLGLSWSWRWPHLHRHQRLYGVSCSWWGCHCHRMGHMSQRKRTGLVPITVTIDPIDVDLLDRLAKLEGINRSAELRSMLAQLRPMLRQTVEAFEAASAARDMLTAEAQQVHVSQLDALMPEVQRVQDAYLGFMARLEGESAAAEAADPRPSNHGGHTPTPTTDPTTPEPGSDAS